MAPILKPCFHASAESHFLGGGANTAFLRLQFLISILLSTVQSWPKKCVLGCVISALRRQVESRNLGQTSLANSVSSDAFWALTTSTMLLAQIGRQSVGQSEPPSH